ncbi:MAG: hypothetical protein ABFS02_06780 [Pseudomonadota bacterium]
MKFHQKKVFWPLAWVICFALPAFAGDAGVVAQENGLLENTQVAFLLLSGIIFTVQSFTAERYARCFLWMAAWFCLSIIVRELDVEDLAVPQWVVWIGSGIGRNLIMAAGWGALGVIAIKSYSEWKSSVVRMARSRTAVFMFITGTLLLLGSLFDHETVMAEQGMFWEEILETIGYFLLLPAAIFSGVLSREQASGTLLPEA